MVQILVKPVKYILLLIFGFTISFCKQNTKNNSVDANAATEKLGVSEKSQLIFNDLENINTEYGYHIEFSETDSVDIPFSSENLKSILNANLNTEAKIKDLFTVLDKFESPNLSKINGMEAVYELLKESKVYNNNLYQRLDSSTVLVRTRNGENIVFQNEVDTLLGNTVYSFSHYDPSIDCFVMSKSFGEGATHKIFVNRNSGQKTEAWGVPILKKNDNTMFGTLSKTGICSDNSNGFQVFSNKSGKISLEFTAGIENFDPENILWIDNNTLILECLDGPEPISRHRFFKIKFSKTNK